MNGQELSRQLNGLPEEMIAEAMAPVNDTSGKFSRSRVLRRLTAVAAAVAIFFTALVLWPTDDEFVTGPGLLTITAYAADGVPYTTSASNSIEPFLHYWSISPVNWSPGCPITLSVNEEAYQSEELSFQVSVQGGGLYTGASGGTSIYPTYFKPMPKTFCVPNHTTIFWSTYFDASTGAYDMFCGDSSYIDIIIYDGAHIVGYAVLRFRLMTWGELLEMRPSAKDIYEKHGYTADQMSGTYRLEMLKD